MSKSFEPHGPLACRKLTNSKQFGSRSACAWNDLAGSIFFAAASNFVLTLSQRTNFRLCQIKGVSRRQFFKFDKKKQKVLKTGRKYCGKGEIACYEKTCTADT